MFEVEKKFILDDESKARLLDGAEFLDKEVFTDKYYDNARYDLTLADNWLRARAGKFEFKMSAGDNSQQSFTRYNEVEDEQTIKAKLGFAADCDLGVELLKNGFEVFCVCTTVRLKYRRGDFHIDIDEVESEGKHFNRAEIELMVEKEDEMIMAQNRIINFAKDLGLEIKPMLGKPVEAIKRCRPKHFAALVKAGIVIDAAN